MWYLIVPPIVVVASLSFALWYLSLKGSDPIIAGRALESEKEAGRQVIFSRMRSFFLRLLEKIAYRFKVASLRSHNALHDLTQSLKASQRRFQPPTSVPVSSESRTARRADSLRQFFGKEEVGADIAQEEALPAETATSATALGVPILRSRKGVSQTEHRTEAVSMNPSEESFPVSRPMVSETATHPERVQKKIIKGNHLREEDYIARIAANPKDFAAYEGLGDYYLEIDNVKDAKECYRQVLKLSPVQRMVKIKIRRLEKILSQKTGGETE